jgi:hypothetical protein
MDAFRKLGYLVYKDYNNAKNTKKAFNSKWEPSSFLILDFINIDIVCLEFRSYRCNKKFGSR